MTEIYNEIIEETEQPIEKIVDIPQRVNPFCVISKAVFGQYNVRDIQTNSAWSSNPYGDGYAVVPDDVVADILETRGFCDIELNEDGTEIIGFTAREIPEIPEPTPEPTAEERISELETQNEMLMNCVLEMSEVVYA
ncbi:MAG: hypothetical protein IKW21_06095 [Lachnospiraceae bacterium]|nr:hypothetical protein [Lachnospiraceae bacterium]